MPYELFENVMTNAEAHAAATAAAAGVAATAGGGPSASAASSYSTSASEQVVDDNLGFAKDRTISRLTEMQSAEYLRAHAKAHAPELLLALTEKS